MPSASVQPAIWTSVISALVLLVGGFWAVGSINDSNEDVMNAVQSIEIPSVDIPDFPTASEIAAEIDIPVPKGSRNSNANLDEILEGVFPKEVKELERECVRDLEDQFSDDDVLDDVQDLIESDLGEEIDNLKITNFNFDDDYDFDVINLGLDDDEDKEAEITSTLRVKYILEDGDQGTIKDKVYAFATCSDYDGEDNEFDDLTVDYSLSDKF